MQTIDTVTLIKLDIHLLQNTLVKVLICFGWPLKWDIKDQKCYLGIMGVILKIMITIAHTFI